MSLTRAQWIEMWDSARKLEKLAEELSTSTRKFLMQLEIEKLKKHIQSVIGQMK